MGVFAGVMLAIVAALMLLYLRAERRSRVSLETQLDLKMRYDRQRCLDPVSSHVFELIEKLKFVTVSDHTQWLQDCVDELEEKFDQHWEYREQFIAPGQGIICWTRTEGMADLFNIPGHYELVCEFLKHDMLYRLMAELEDALPDGSEMENHEI